MIPNRRAVLGAGLGVTTGFAFSAGGGAAPQTEGAPSLSRDPNVLDAAATDFGRILRKVPMGVHRPTSGADIADLLRWASGQRIKVAARGQGHSIYGRALAEGGIIVDTSGMTGIAEFRSDHLTVEAGATWQSVLDATLPRGATPPVLTNYLGLSIGGTLAVGGIGGSSSRYGMQTDQVLELDVVTGDGREFRCSPTANAELFDAVRAGLGQYGIVTRATLRLVRAPERVRRFQLSYPDLAALMVDQRRALTEERFDQLQGAILPAPAGGWRYQLEGAVFHDGSAPSDGRDVLEGLSDDRPAAVSMAATYRDDAQAFAKLERLLRSNGQWFNPQPWLLTFLRGSNAGQLAGEILEGLTAADLGPFGRITCYPMFTKAIRTPLVRMPDEDIVFVFNVIRIPASDDAAEKARMIEQNRVLYDRIRNAGGALYPVSALPMTAEDWKDHFGSKWQRFEQAARKYDPSHILTPGYDPFAQT